MENILEKINAYQEILATMPTNNKKNIEKYMYDRKTLRNDDVSNNVILNEAETEKLKEDIHDLFNDEKYKDLMNDAMEKFKKAKENENSENQ